MKKIIHNSLLFTLICALVSCKSSYKEEEGMTVFRYNEASNITSLDPVYARNQANIWATSQVFNSLVQLDENLEVIPAIAHRWEISDGGLQYTFFLRDDVYFHDDPAFDKGKGRRVVAQDFVYSFARIVDPSVNSPGSWVMNPVARHQDGSLAIKAPSDSVLVILLQEPFPAMTGLLCMQYCSVVPHEAIDKYGQEFRRNPIGTGPFRFRYWKEGVKLVMVKNSGYFEFDSQGNQLPFLDAVAVTFIIDRQTAFLEFIKGNLDFLSGVDASYKDELLTLAGNLQPKYQDRFYKLAGPFLNTEYLGIFMEQTKEEDISILQKKQIRQAINYGFDREKMLLYLRNNIGTPAHAGFVPLGMPGFTVNEGGFYYDPAKSRNLLAEAGFPEGQGLPAIGLATTSQYLDIAQYIQHELSLLGIRMSIDVIPPATLREMLSKGDAPFFRHSWIADYPDAENYLALFYTPNHAPHGPNYTRFSNHEFDRLYEKSVSIVEDSLRHEYYRQMDNIIIAEAPVVVLYYDQFIRFLPHYVSNMQVNPLNHLILKTVTIEK